jgi:hypothetical protein
MWIYFKNNWVLFILKMSRSCGSPFISDHYIYPSIHPSIHPSILLSVCPILQQLSPSSGNQTPFPSQYHNLTLQDQHSCHHLQHLIKCTVWNTTNVSHDFASVMVIIRHAVEFINFKSVLGKTERKYLRIWWRRHTRKWNLIKSYLYSLWNFNGKTWEFLSVAMNNTDVPSTYIFLYIIAAVRY